MSNQQQGNDPRFTSDGNAAVGQFYSSGGLNDSTGREPFETPPAQGFTGVGHNNNNQTTSSGLGGLGHGQSHGDQTHSSGLGGLGQGQHSHGDQTHSNTNTSASGEGVIGKIASKLGAKNDDHLSTNKSSHLGDSQRGDGFNTTSGYSQGRENALGYEQGGQLGQNEQRLGGHGLGEGRRDDESHHGHSHHQHGSGLTGREIESEQTKGRGLQGSDGLFSTGTPSHTIHSGTNTTGQSTGQYGSNTAAHDYQSSTSNVGSGLGHNHDHSSSHTPNVGTGLPRGGLASETDRHHNDHSSNTSGGGLKEKLGLDNKDRVERTHANEGPGAAGVGASGLGPNHGLSSGAPTGLATGGLAASTGDRPFGHDQASKVTNDGAYGEGDFNKQTTNQDATRHGDDFTGGFAATGGAYHNPHAKTALTGRETTATGVHDQHGNDTQKLSLMDKIKNAVGGHKNDSNAATQGEDTVRSDVNRS